MTRGGNMSEVVPGSNPSEIHPEAPAALDPNSRVTSENAPAKTFGTVLVQPEKPRIGTPTNSRSQVLMASGETLHLWTCCF